MKIFIACSKHFYNRIPEIMEELERMGHQVKMPNSYDEPLKEEEMRNVGSNEHANWKADMLRKDKENIMPNDAILVLNFEKNGNANYIGGATFLEIAKSFELDKNIFLFNPIPDNIFRDELLGMQPIILNGDLSIIGGDIKKGVYRHYKGNNYELLEIGRHSETREEFVVYRALYNSEEFGSDSVWIRPKKMFFENVVYEGTEIPRFTYIGDRNGSVN